jgi:hypothetical protein
MVDKRVVLVGVGTIIQMIKDCLLEWKGITVIEVAPATIEDLVIFVNQELPNVIIFEQSTATPGFLEKLLMIAKEKNIKVVEVNLHSNTVQVANWHQIQLERMQDFVAVL